MGLLTALALAAPDAGVDVVAGFEMDPGLEGPFPEGGCLGGAGNTVAAGASFPTCVFRALAFPFTSPSLLQVSGSAPAFSSSSAEYVWLRFTAQPRAEVPPLSTDLTSAPFSSSSFNTSMVPFFAEYISGVSPFCRQVNKACSHRVVYQQA